MLQILKCADTDNAMTKCYDADNQIQCWCHAIWILRYNYYDANTIMQKMMSCKKRYHAKTISYNWCHENAVMQMLSCKCYHANAIMQMLSCKCYHANAIMQMLWSMDVILTLDIFYKNSHNTSRVPLSMMYAL